MIDENNLTPSDFTVMVFNLPLNVTKDELKQWLENEHGLDRIMNIVYCYDINHVINKIKQYNSAVTTQSYIKAYQNRCANAISQSEDVNVPPSRRYL